MSSKILRCIIEYAVPDVSENRGYFILTLKITALQLFDKSVNIYVLLTVHIGIIPVNDQLDAQFILTCICLSRGLFRMTLVTAL
jgi:hypothetical protein